MASSPLYAVVDLETTGGRPEQDGIIEVAVVITNGKEVIEEYETLVNPGRRIPSFIEGLTGISQSMLSDAPTFADIADTLLPLLQDKIFVAHNVAFDYNFLRHHFRLNGQSLSEKRLCTVRYARAVVPDLPSYSLGKLCRSLDISINGRHRAYGDAYATTQLLHLLLDQDHELGHQLKLLKRQGNKTNLPPNLPFEVYEGLPTTPGVYYFMDDRQQVLYVGKARNIRKRVNAHFSKDLKMKNMKALFEQLHHIDYELTGSELIAYLHEAKEIKRLQPTFNRALKRREKGYGLYTYFDQNGYMRLALNRLKGQEEPHLIFPSVAEGRRFLYRLSMDHGLCEKMIGLQRTADACTDFTVGRCEGPCVGDWPPQSHNARLQTALSELSHLQSNVLIVGLGRSFTEKSVVCCENGKLVGYGYVDADHTVSSPDEAKDLISPVPHTADTQRIVRAYLHRPSKDDTIIRY